MQHQMQKSCAYARSKLHIHALLFLSRDRRWRRKIIVHARTSLASQILVRHSLTRTFWRLVHRRRHIRIRVRRRRIHVEALAVRIVVCVSLLVWLLVVRLCVVDSPPRHPAEERARSLAAADAALGVVVAADEVEEDCGEEEGDYCVAESHSGLVRSG